ncbi:hypothetical protein O6H91_01G152000 [Diphasiastrum complanatum]|uniref:Uncharacterized protein n=1 Tax=Diphasiastrum complanatum TaxID=34168 RepID=A0ACC2EXB7_DIPCM|nr:hypothetical protein O6H91_01G152000 [Diphasiastrum complanatum]
MAFTCLYLDCCAFHYLLPSNLGKSNKSQVVALGLDIPIVLVSMSTRVSTSWPPTNELKRVMLPYEYTVLPPWVPPLFVLPQPYFHFPILPMHPRALAFYVMSS